MSKMIIYFYLLIPLLCLTVDSSSIRGRNNKNELVPLNSRVGSPQAKDNSLKLISNDPYIMRIPLPKENEKKDTKGGDKNTKRMNKKRISKLKSLRKKHRFRRDLSKLKPNRDEKSFLGDKPESHHDIKNITKNGSNRAEILKVLSHSKRKETKRTDQLKELKAGTVKPGLNRTPPKLGTPLAKLVYPSTPKHDKHSHKYTYKDLLADRKRLEQKINYIKNMFSANDSTTDEPSRVRRRSESDRTANKIAKMFLTLSAVNGLHEKRKSRCRSVGGEDDDRVQDVWEKERRENPSRKSSSSNEERYKVKKWIEFMKKKRSSGKTCPCLASVHGDEGDAFPLEQKLPKGYFLLERKGSSEESSETYKDPYYNSRDPLTANSKRRYGKDQDAKSKEDSKNGKKKLSLPLTDLELYRSRAKQILQNAEEILDRIKEEEERRLATPNILMNQLKELTSRIHGDPRNNENDLIRKIQKNLGWNPLAKAKDTDGNTFVDNVKSYILDPYEKAKALTDESTKMLSSYLLRNLGKIQESSEEQDARAAEDETDDIRTKLEKPLVSSSNKQDPLARNKEEIEHWEDTISTILQGPEENAQKEAELAMKQENIKNRMQDIIKEQQKKLTDYEINGSEETDKEFEDPIIQSTKETSKSSEIPNDVETLQMSQPNTHKISEKQKETTKDVVEMETPDSVQQNTHKISENQKQTSKDILKMKTPDSEQHNTHKITGNQKQPAKDVVEMETPGTEQHDTHKITKNQKQTAQDVVEMEAPDSKQQNTHKISENQKQTAKDILEMETPDTEQLRDEKKNSNSKKPETFDEPTQKENVNLEDSQAETFQTSAEKLQQQKPQKQTNRQKQYPNVKIPAVGTFDRMEPDVLASPHDIADDYLFLEDEYEAGNDENLKEPLRVNLEEGLTEPRENEETLLEKLREIETELKEEESELENEAEKLKALDSSKHNEETENLKETFKDPSMHNQEADQNPNIKTETQEAEKPPEHADLVKETSQGSTETDPAETDSKPTDEQLTLQKAKSNENSQETVEIEENLQSQHENSGEVKRENSEEEALKSEENLEEPKSDILEAALGNQETKEQSAEKSDENRETENEETPLQSTQNERKESSETFSEETLKDNLEERNDESDEATLKSENPPEEIDKQSSETLTDGKDELVLQKTLTDGKDETVLQKTNLDETPLREALDALTDQEDLDLNVEAAPKEATLEENDEVQQTRKEDSDEMSLQEILNEERDLEEETAVESANPIQDLTDKETQNSYEEPDATLPKDNTNEETILKSENLENNTDYDDETSSENLTAPKNENEQTDDETLLKAVNSQESVEEQSEKQNEKYDSEENLRSENAETENLRSENPETENFRSENPEAETSEETLERSALDTETQEDAQDETPLMKANPDEEAKSSEKSNKHTSSEALNEFIETLNLKNDENDEETLKSANPNADDQNSNEETLDKLLESALDQESNEDQVKAQPEQNEPENDDTPLQATLDDQNEENIQTTNDDELSNSNPNSSEQPRNQETEMLESAKSTPEQQTNQQETVQTEFRSLEDQDDQSFETNDPETFTNESNPMEKSENLDNEILESSLEEKSNQQETEDSDETPLRANLETEDSDETPLKSTLDNEDEGTSDEEPYIKESNPENLESDETPVESVNPSTTGSDETARQEQNKATGVADETSDEVDKIVQSNLEKDGDSLKSTNYDPETDETLQSANPSEQTDEDTPLRSTNLEDFDNKIDETPLQSTNDQRSNLESDFDDNLDETSLKSSNPMDQTNDPDSSLDNSKETLRAEHIDDFDNQIDEETPLRSSHDTETAETFDDSFETLRQQPQLGENLIMEDDSGQTSLETQNQRSQDDVLQIPDPTTKSLKPNKLKLPKSIGKIMRDLGKEKGDITSIDNLNPEKIDDIIGKIDAAEHQENLLENHEVDCRKECACADDIDSRSKNLGRYEIVKDFLHWMKDLQINRVLSDD